MKQILLSSVLCLLLFSASAQSEVMLHFAHRVGEAPFAMGTTYMAPGEYEFKFDRLEYYLSEIELIHDGGQVTPVANTWLLVRPAQQSSFSLGSHAITSLEGINFSVGVDSFTNHQDPASYAANHPLAPQNPSMHWGWQAGYRFAAVEGYSGSGLVFGYQIHALGNENYQDVSLSLDPISGSDTLRVNVLADYKAMFNEIDLSGGGITHGATGDAITLLANMGTSVFSQDTTSASTAVEPDFAGTFRVGPNPATGPAQVYYELPGGFTYQLSLADLSGRVIQSETLTQRNGSLTLPPLSGGLYFVRLQQNQRTVAIEKLSVLR